MEKQGTLKIRDLRGAKRIFIVDHLYIDHYAKRCGVSATAVYAALCRHSDIEKQTCFPSHQYLANELGMSARTVQTALKKLVAWQIIQIGKLIRKSGGFASNEYTLVDRSEWKPYDAQQLLPTAIISDGKKQHEREAKNDVPQRQPLPTKKTHMKETQIKEIHSAFKLSYLLMELIIQNNPTGRLANLDPKEKEQKITSWSKDIGKLLENDKQMAEKVESVIRYCQANSFWKTNILSGKKLRERFDQLSLKMDSAKQCAKEPKHEPNQYTDIPAELRA